MQFRIDLLRNNNAIPLASFVWEPKPEDEPKNWHLDICSSPQNMMYGGPDLIVCQIRRIL